MAEGYTLAILGTVLSACARVYTEYLMKRTNDSIFFRNLQLYLWVQNHQHSKFACHKKMPPLADLGCCSITLDYLGNGWQYGSWISRIGVNYNTASWLVMGNMALTGILISCIMKYANVLVKVQSAKPLARKEGGEENMTTPSCTFHLRCMQHQWP
jgi:solute carrier family 35 (UDP-sugar transporter), member A1/2/3